MDVRGVANGFAYQQLKRRRQRTMIPCGEAPYTGANRIRFEGTLSADLGRHPRFLTNNNPAI
jgi:hypothetical protein